MKSEAELSLRATKLLRCFSYSTFSGVVDVSIIDNDKGLGISTGGFPHFFVMKNYKWLKTPILKDYPQATFKHENGVLWVKGI